MLGQEEKAKELSKEVLNVARNTILINLRFMDVALAELELVASFSSRAMATDGIHLVYNPMDILKTYLGERYLVNRDYLHLFLHCLYRHNFVNELLDEAVWDLACDITVENIINELSVASLDARRTLKQVTIIAELKSKLKFLTAEKIYRYYLDQKIAESEISKIRENFLADCHNLWYQKESGSSNIGISNSTKNDDDRSDNIENTDDCNSKYAESQDDVSSENFKNDSERKKQEERWKEISERMQQDLETFSKDRGDKAGSLLQNLGEVNREKYDYKSFLKKFAVMGEAMKINDDEFDYVFYTYGLKLYKKMPLIEPLEYKEVKRIRDFAIIIDTSGSVSGELVQIFVNKTYNILKETESFFSKINLYIIQCDARVQEVVKITTQEEFEEYLKNMKLHGFGGTDFRPAFEFVDNLVKTGELPKLKGVIYFTDGFGDFPAKKPHYDAAFVFIRDEMFNPTTPPWAIKLILNKEEI